MGKRRTTRFTDTDVVIKPQPDPPAPEDATETLAGTPTTGASKFTIEEVDVPGRRGRSTRLSYPVSSLVAGSKQSFFVPATPEKLAKVTTSVRTFSQRNGITVIIRNVEGGIRVWRKADKETSFEGHD